MVCEIRLGALDIGEEPLAAKYTHLTLCAARKYKWPQLACVPGQQTRLTEARLCLLVYAGG